MPLFSKANFFRMPLPCSHGGARSANACKKLLRCAALLSVSALATGAVAQTAAHPFVFSRDGRTVALEPYAPGILRVTIAKTEAAALQTPGYGVSGKPAMAGWVHERAGNQDEVFRSERMVVKLTPEHLPVDRKTRRMQLDQVNQDLRGHYFGEFPNLAPDDDTITFATAAGKPLLVMRKWAMRPNKPDAQLNPLTHAVDDPGSRISATFDSPADEHYYGLGQQQQGFLDLRGHEIRCWQDYSAVGGQVDCVPFLVSSRGYGLIWDNPSKTTVALGFNGVNTWSSEVGDRITFFVIAGDNTDEIYTGYRQLTGTTHLLPKAAYGYIQSKAIYPSQAQLLEMVKGYRDRKLPLDIAVVDFLNMTQQGELDLDTGSVA